MSKNNWLIIIGLVLYCALIFYLSSLPGDSIPNFAVSDKIIHFFLYLGLGLISTHFLYGLKFSSSRVKIVVITLAFTALYGLSDEIHQLFVIGRNFDVLDLFVDIIGGFSGCLIMSYLYPRVQSILLKFD
jgi:VanZ family protein